MWNASLIQSMLILASSLAVMGVTWHSAPSIALTFVVTSSWSLMTLLVLWMFRKSKPVDLTSWLYIGSVLICAIGVNVNQEFWLRAGIPFAPFFGFKYIALLMALQAPPKRWVGRVTLSIVFIFPLIQYLSWEVTEKKLIGVQEPWLTLLSVVCAVVLYEQRLQTLAMAEKKARLEAGAQEMRRYAHLLIGAQHLLNTPLQVIQSTAELIRLRHPDSGPLVDQIDKAFVPVQEINRLLSFGRKHVDWKDVKLPETVAELEQEIYRDQPSSSQS
jgi:signal transduction histidine kinase